MIFIIISGSFPRFRLDKRKGKRLVGDTFVHLKNYFFSKGLKENGVTLILWSLDVRTHGILD